MSDNLDEIFDHACVIGAEYSLAVIWDGPGRNSYWSLEYCFNNIKENGGVIRIDISKTPLQRILDNVT